MKVLPLGEYLLKSSCVSGSILYSDGKKKRCAVGLRCGKLHPIDWDPTANNKTESKLSVSIHLSSLPNSRGSGTARLPFFLLWLSCFDRLYPQTVSWNKSFLPSVAFISVCFVLIRTKRAWHFWKALRREFLVCEQKQGRAANEIIVEGNSVYLRD